MNIKRRITESIRECIENYDFEDAIDDALGSIDIGGIIDRRLRSKIEKVDITPFIQSVVEDIIDEEIDDPDIEGEVLDLLRDQLDD